MNFVTLRSGDVLPVHQHSGVGENKANVHHGVLQPDALMGSAAEGKVVLRVSVSKALRVKPTFRLEHVGIREYFLVKVHELIARSDDSLIANVSMTSFMW